MTIICGSFINLNKRRREMLCRLHRDRLCVS